MRLYGYLHPLTRARPRRTRISKAAGEEPGTAAHQAPPRIRLPAGYRLSLPRPPAGAGSVRGDIRRTAVSGFFPAYSRILDRGDIATGGWGRRGGGTRSPSPVSNTPETPHISPTPPHLATHTPLAGPPPHPRLRRSSPASVGGRGSERRYPVGSRIRGGAWWAAVPGSSPAVLLIRVLHGLA